jgi:hypothetical protein
MRLARRRRPRHPFPARITYHRAVQDSLPMIFIVGGIAIVVAIVAYIAWLHEKKRREELAVLAAEWGWRFDPARDRRHDREYSCFEVFRRGHSRAAYNTLTGTFAVDGRQYEAKAGDFTYKITTSSGKSSSTTTYQFSYIIIHLPWRTPNLLIRREGLLDRLAGIFGFADINFESETFSRRFHVRSPDKRFAYDVIDPRMMEFMLETDPPVIDIEGGRCCITDGTRRWKPDEFRTRMAWLHDFLSRWPGHLKRTLDGGRAAQHLGQP